MGLDYHDEYITNEGYAVDIQLEGIWEDRNGSKKQLCIEVDGPFHYYSNSRRVTASTFYFDEASTFESFRLACIIDFILEMLRIMKV